MASSHTVLAHPPALPCLRRLLQQQQRKFSAIVRGDISTDLFSDSQLALLLYDASRIGHSEAVSVLLAAGAAVNRANDNGATPLHIASLQGHSATVSTLCTAGAAVDQEKYNGMTALFIASGTGHSETVSVLLAAGADVDRAQGDGMTPLLVASGAGHSETVSVLLAAGAGVNKAKNNGTAPLLVASLKGHAETVTVLLAAGAAVNLAQSDGITPLLAASRQGHSETVSILCAASADVNQGPDGMTPLLVAVHHGHLACVQLLSTYGARRTLALAESMSAEEVALLHGHEPVHRWLVASKQWSTPLHHLDTLDASRARALLRDGAGLRAQEATGGPTPLSIAQRMHAAGAVTDGSAADLVLRAACPWSPDTHALFPAASRAYAVEMMLVGHHLAREPRFEAEAAGLLDVWMTAVMPHLVLR